jgi:hypothetical protein
MQTRKPGSFKCIFFILGGYLYHSFFGSNITILVFFYCIYRGMGFEHFTQCV